MPATAVNSPKRFTRSTSWTSPPAIVGGAIRPAPPRRVNRSATTRVRSITHGAWNAADPARLAAAPDRAAEAPRDRPAAGRLLVVRPVLGRLGHPRRRAPTGTTRSVVRTRSGVLLALPSIVAVVVMALRRAPRLTALPIGALSVPLSSDGARRSARVRDGACRRQALCWSRSSWSGAGNGLIDVYPERRGAAGRRSRTRPAGAAVAARQLRSRQASPGAVGGRSHRGGRAWTTGSVLVFAGVVWPSRPCGTASSAACGRRSAAARDHAFSISALFRRHRRCGCRRSWSCSRSWSRDRWTRGRASTCRTSWARRHRGPPLAFVAFSAALLLGRLFAGRVLFGCGRRTHDRRRRASASAIGGTIAALAEQPGGRRGRASCCSVSRSPPRPRRAFGLVDEAPTRIRRTRSPRSPPWATPGFIWSPPLSGWIAQSVQPPRGDGA